MTVYNPIPYDIKKPIVSYLRKNGQTIEYLGTPHLVKGRLNIEDVDRAWYAGVISIDESGCISICGISVRASVDSTKLKNQIIHYLRSEALPVDLVNVASTLRIGL